MKGRTISPGKTQGIALVSQEPVSFYGGIDVNTGIVIEKGHELEGQLHDSRLLPLNSHLENNPISKKV